MNANSAINMRINTKNWITTLLIVLMVGLFIYSIAILLLYNIMSPDSYTAGAEQLEMFKLRMNIHRIAEGVQGISATLFYIGSIILAYRFVKAGAPVSIKKIIFLFGGMAVIVLSCPGIFSIIDLNSWGDYFFPIWAILAHIITVFVVVTIANFIKQRRWR